MSEKESPIYAIDRNGKVWVINLQGNPNQRNPIWTILPNPGKIDFKRLSSLNDSVWGISSDHQIYVYIQKPDVPIRVREETFENQRWNPLGGFCDNLLPTDRFPFSNEAGTHNRDKKIIKLPSEAWVWKGEWQIENTLDSQVLGAECWTYAVDFPATYAPTKDWKSCVRRRKWYRIREYIATNRWNLVQSIHEDHTADPFTDVGASSFGSSNHDASCVWAITVNGKVYFRNSVSRYQPEGSEWISVPVTKGVQDAAQVAVSATGTPFIVSWTGGLLYRIGITPMNLSGTDWLTTNGPPGGIFQLSAGKDTLWVITRDRKCWSLKGKTLQDILSTKSLEPFEWMEIPGKLKAISVSKTDLVVLGIGNDDNDVFFRFGVSKDQLHGQGWKEAFAGTSWDTISTCSGVSESSSTSEHQESFHDRPDGDGNESDESEVSIRPDIPQVTPLIDGGSGDHTHSYTVQNLCWVDGGCASVLKLVQETDLEVGPWREEILTGLNFRKVERSKFEYPNAIEPANANSSWATSTKARMLQHRKGATWMKGEVEISNNDTLVFYKDLHHSWMTAVSDILSVFICRDRASSFTMRVRNAIEAGIADFVTFKFENEQNMEEWRQTLLEASSKPYEEWCFRNAWITTTNGEIHEAGLIKMTDTPIGAEVVTPGGGSELRIHHPLLKGFLPGSEVIIDIVIPADGKRFAFNLNGRDSSIFHFNPRLTDKVVVRNSRDTKGDWGEEERDGVFPFTPGQGYAIKIQCEDSQFVTTVSTKHKFMFYYKHRFLPKYITHFTAVGDVNVVGIRYDPAKSDEVKHIEFLTKPVPGHFWKVESAAKGHTWAVGVDMNVWAYTGGTKELRRAEGDNIVTDEQVYVIYENQRWNPLTGFSSQGLPTDRSPWSDETGRQPLEKDIIKLPSCAWTWVAEWEIDYEVKNGVDKFGWQYAIDFPASYHSSKKFNDFVRRRRWKRIGIHKTSGPWILIPNIKLIDVCVRMNDECDYDVLGICQNGDAVVRCGITSDNPAGTNWEPLTSQKPFVSISGWYKEKIWAIGKDGFAYIRYQNNWQLLDRPMRTPLKQIRVGPAGIWAVGTNNVLYRRTDVQASVFPEGKDWVKACDGVLQISMGTDETLWALIKNGENYQCSIAKRKGISPNNPNGIGWEIIAEGPWRYFSATGAYSRNI